jgi:hypothetical protein
MAGRRSAQLRPVAQRRKPPGRIQSRLIYAVEGAGIGALDLCNRRRLRFNDDAKMRVGKTGAGGESRSCTFTEIQVNSRQYLPGIFDVEL